MTLKEFFPPKRICEKYPYGAKWYQRMLWKVTEVIKKGLNFLAWVGITGSVAYGIFILGWYSKPMEVTAIDRVEVKDNGLPPVLQRICKAESGNRQFRESGDVLRGHITPDDIGYCQINEPTWNDQARKMGIDIYTEEGNKQMAIYIFENQGTTPWNSSKCSSIKVTNCWK